MTNTASGVVIKHWISERQREKQLDQVVQLSEQETDRLRIIMQAEKREPVLAQARADVEDSHNQILKTMKPSDHIEIADLQMDGGEVSEIVQTERARSEDIDIQGIFRIQANDTTQPGGFRITVSRISDGEVFSAVVPTELPRHQQRLIQDAEWSKGATFVRLSITASLLRGKIQDAKVYSAEAVE